MTKYKFTVSRFPYIIYDVSWPVHSFRLTLLTSGLCIASRFPFVDAVFHAFPHGSRDDKLACKGLLMTKVCRYVLLVLPFFIHYR